MLHIVVAKTCNIAFNSIYKLLPMRKVFIKWPTQISVWPILGLPIFQMLEPPLPPGAGPSYATVSHFSYKVGTQKISFTGADNLKTTEEKERNILS